MKPEKQQLIHDLLGDDGYRAATLAAGARVLRRRRHWRIASQGLALLLVVAMSCFWLARKEAPRSRAPLLVRVAAPVAAPQSQALTDDQLLSLFPNTPVALATLSNGKKQLIFLHPGDQKKYVTRL